jgi:Family of unknown function (DUF6345)
VTRFGAAWCTHFRRRGWTTYPRLEWNYRAAGLFATQFQNRGSKEVKQLGCDEGFTAADYDGSRARVADGLDLLYCAAHGELRNKSFELVLHADEWEPAAAGLDGSDSPRVAVFDACNLVDLTDPNWPAPWEAVAWPRLRLLCGFASNATVGKGPTERGREFAQLLDADEPVASAWLRAVVAHSSRLQRDTAVAIGLGTDAADADDALDATLDDLLAMPTLTGTITALARKAR